MHSSFIFSLNLFLKEKEGEEKVIHEFNFEKKKLEKNDIYGLYTCYQRVVNHSAHSPQERGYSLVPRYQLKSR